jgi:hypothetical protein
LFRTPPPLGGPPGPILGVTGQFIFCKKHSFYKLRLFVVKFSSKNGQKMTSGILVNDEWHFG